MQEIERALELTPDLWAVLAKELGKTERAGQALPADIARHLCDPAVDLLAALDALDKALGVLAQPPRPAADEVARYRQSALTLLGWTSVATVADGYEQEDATLAQRWRDGAVFSVPLGHGPCVEVLTARWRDGKAELDINPAGNDHGPDDLLPALMQEIGFDDPEDLRPDRALDAVWNRVHQEMLRRQANGLAPRARRQDARRWLQGQLRKYKRRLRLVLDLHHPLADRDVLQAIHGEMPELLLILVDDEADEDPSIFILHPATLSAAIYDCLDAIRSLA